MGRHAKPILRGAEAQRRQTKLRDLRVSRLTLLRYRDAVAIFTYFCLLTFRRMAGDLEELDAMGVEFIESCWEEMEPKSVVSTTLAGIQHFLQRKRCLPRSWWALGTWSLYDLPARAPPIPALLAYALAGKALAENLPGLAAAVVLGFAGFLRTGEILSMQYGHVALFDGIAVISLPLTKMGRRRGAEEMVTVECPIAIALFNIASKVAYAHEHLAVTPDFFREWWRRAVTALDLDPAIWRPYGLRRGGATHHFRQFGHLETTIFKGRWASSTTARTYIVEAMSVLARSQLDIASHVLAKSWLRVLFGRLEACV